MNFVIFLKNDEILPEFRRNGQDMTNCLEFFGTVRPREKGQRRYCGELAGKTAATTAQLRRYDYTKSPTATTRELRGTEHTGSGRAPTAEC